LFVYPSTSGQIYVLILVEDKWRNEYLLISNSWTAHNLINTSQHIRTRFFLQILSDLVFFLFQFDLERNPVMVLKTVQHTSTYLTVRLVDPSQLFCLDKTFTCFTLLKKNDWTTLTFAHCDHFYPDLTWFPRFPTLESRLLLIQCHPTAHCWALTTAI
jgi:hypothetical protein